MKRENSKCKRTKKIKKNQCDPPDSQFDFAIKKHSKLIFMIFIYIAMTCAIDVLLMFLLDETIPELETQFFIHHTLVVFIYLFLLVDKEPKNIVIITNLVQWFSNLNSTKPQLEFIALKDLYKEEAPTIIMVIIKMICFSYLDYINE